MAYIYYKNGEYDVASLIRDGQFDHNFDQRIKFDIEKVEPEKLLVRVL